MAVSKVILNGTTLIDTTDKTVTSASMLSGTTALKNDGTTVEGNIPAKTSSDLTASGATVTVPAGYYSSAASKSVASMTLPSSLAIAPTTGYTKLLTVDRQTSAKYINIEEGYNSTPSYYEIASVKDGTAGTPTATKGTVSNNSVSITPSVTNTTGYISGGTKNGTAVTVSASELVSGTKSISAAGETDVTNYAKASVAAGAAATPSTSITANPTISVSASGLITATASASKSITPTVSAGYVSSGTAGTVSVSGSNTQQLSTQAAATITPSTTSQTAVAAGKYTTGAVTVDPIPSQYIVPSGTKEITENGTGIDVTNYATVDVTVESEPNIESLTVIPTSTNQIFAGYQQVYSIPTGQKTNGAQGSNKFMCLLSNPAPSFTEGKTYYVSGEIRCVSQNDGVTTTYNINGEWTYNLKDSSTYKYSPTLPFSPTFQEDSHAPRWMGIEVYTYSPTDIQIYLSCTLFSVKSFIVVQEITFKEKTLDGYLPVTVNGDANLVPENIADGVSIFGVSGTHQGGGYDETLIKNWIQRAGAFKTIDWPADLTTIGFGAFARCTEFDTSSLPSTLHIISDYAFNNCQALSISSLPSGVTSIGQYAFERCYRIGLTSLPNGISRVSYSTFTDCYSISLSELPSSVTYIGGYAFARCPGITSISCDGAITDFGSYCFSGSSSYPSNLKSARFPNMVISSLGQAFGHTTAASSCNLLEFADIGSSKAIAASAFANCYALETLVLRRSDAICTLANVSAFLNTPMRGYNSLTGTVYVPSALISSYQAATNWSTLYNAGTVTFVAIEGSEYEL